MFQIALTGKGSSGKSTLAPFLLARLASLGRVLVVDADPHMTSTRLLGFPTELVTLGRLRSQYERQFKSGAGLPPDETREAFAETMMGTQALRHAAAFDFLPMGHWEPNGSQCTVNRVLGRALSHLAGEYDLVLVDHEAGIETIGRFADPVDLLLVMTTPDPLFLDVAEKIWQRCLEVNRPVRQARLLLNRVEAGEADDPDLTARLAQCPLLFISPFLPESPALRRLSRSGGALLDLPPLDPWRAAVDQIIDTLLTSHILPFLPPQQQKVTSP